MTYDFTSIIDRTGKDALAVELPAAARESGEGYFAVSIREGFDAIPMWVADMNFATAPSIPAAIRERLEHPVYGYFSPRKESSLCHYNSMNLLSMYALIGAYTPEGEAWLAELKEVLTKNIDYAYEYITTRWKGVKVSKPQATYMLFLDCEEWCKVHGKTMDELQQAGLSVGVLWQDGRAFHGQYAIRMNLALPFARVQEAFRRLDEYVF